MMAVRSTPDDRPLAVDLSITIPVIIFGKVARFDPIAKIDFITMTVVPDPDDLSQVVESCSPPPLLS